MENIELLMLILTILSTIIAGASLIFIILIQFKSKGMNDDVWDMIRISGTFIALDYINKNRENLNDQDFTAINNYFRHNVSYSEPYNLKKMYHADYEKFILFVNKQIASRKK